MKEGRKCIRALSFPENEMNLLKKRLKKIEVNASGFSLHSFQSVVFRLYNCRVECEREERERVVERRGRSDPLRIPRPRDRVRSISGPDI